MPELRILTSSDPTTLERAVEDQVVAEVVAARQHAQIDNCLWIVPTRRKQQQLVRSLAARVGAPCFAPPPTTFEQFATLVLNRAKRPATPISSTLKRLIIRRVVARLLQADAFSYFRSIADSSGFLDLMDAFISECKRAEIWPEHFAEACQSFGRMSLRDQELHTVYSDYQQVLQSQNWFDGAGRLWSARDCLARDPDLRLPQWSLIALTGFSDFTRTQLDILAALARRTERLVCGLAFEPQDGRSELFAKPLATAGLLRETLSGIATIAQNHVPPQPESPTRQQIRRGLFGNPRTIAPLPQASGLEVVAAIGPRSELVSISRRVKSLLRDGVSPADVIVGVRDLNEDGLRWSTGLSDAGIPCWIETAQLLRESGVVKFLIALMQTELEDWPFERLMGVLNSSYYRPPENRTGNAAATVSQALRRMRLDRGRHVMLDVLKRAGQIATSLGEDPETERLDDSSDAWRERCQRALSTLVSYSRMTEVLRQSRSLAEWIDILAELMTRLGVLPSSSELQFDVDPVDQAIWNQVQKALRTAAVAEAEFHTPTTLSLREFLEEFRDLLAEERRDVPPEPAGVVRILGFDQLRHLDVPYVFLVGLTEESFPRRRGEDCLLSDVERRRFCEAGLALRHSTDHQQDEMFFCYSLMLRAQTHLTLSYAAVSERGQPAFASPYVSALRTLFTPDALPILHEGQLDPIPAAADVLSPADVRLAATEAALEGRSGWLAALARERLTLPMVANVAGAVEMAVQRFHTLGFTPYEGRLEAPANTRALHDRFSTERQFSATELELYSACPFRFWMSTVLGLRPLEPPEAGTDQLRRGQLVHDVLAQLLGDPTAVPAANELADRFRELTERNLGRAIGDTELERALTRIEQRLLAEWAEAFSEQHANYTRQLSEVGAIEWTPLKPEQPFGDVPNSPKAETAPPLEIGSGELTIKLRGRIDRIDVGTQPDGTQGFIVIDYKTGRTPSFSEKDLAHGRGIQLAIYTVAARRLGLVPETSWPFQIGYWSLKETGFRAGASRGGKLKAIERSVWQAWEQLLDDLLPRIAASIRSGEFVVDNPDKNCTAHCEYRTTCRVNQVRPIAERLKKQRG